MWIFKYIIVCQEYSQLFTNLIAEQWNSILIPSKSVSGAEL